MKKRGRLKLRFFFALCTEKDKIFFNVPKRRRTADDYVRLMTIARCLGFPHVLLRFVYELEHHGDMLNKVYARLDRLKNEKPTVKKWVIEFLTEIPLPEFQPVAREYIAKFESIRDEDFDFSNF